MVAGGFAFLPIPFGFASGPHGQQACRQYLRSLTALCLGRGLNGAGGFGKEDAVCDRPNPCQVGLVPYLPGRDRLVGQRRVFAPELPAVAIVTHHVVNAAEERGPSATGWQPSPNGDFSMDRDAAFCCCFDIGVVVVGVVQRQTKGLRPGLSYLLHFGTDRPRFHPANPKRERRGLADSQQEHQARQQCNGERRSPTLTERHGSLEAAMLAPAPLIPPNRVTVCL